MKVPKSDDSWSPMWKECHFYDTLEILSGRNNLGYRYAYRNRYNAVRDSIRKYLPAGATILDVAAAQGNFTLRLAEDGYKMIWNDLRADLVDYVKLKYEKGHVEFRPGNIFEIDLVNKVDGVIITEIIEHVAHPDEFLKRIACLVKNDGYIFMSTPLGSYFLNRLPKFSDCPDPGRYDDVQFKPNSDGHIFLLHIEEVEILAAKAGLSIVNLLVFNNLVTSGHIKTQAILRVLPEGFISAFERLSRMLPVFLKKRIHANMAAVLRKRSRVSE